MNHIITQKDGIPDFEEQVDKILNNLINVDFYNPSCLYFLNEKQVVQWGKKYDDWVQKLYQQKVDVTRWGANDTDIAYGAIAYFCGYWYEPVNSYLRNGKNVNTATIVNKIIEKMDNEMRICRLEDDLISIRWTQSNEFLNSYGTALNDVEVGTILTDKSFISTSLSLKYRENSNMDKRKLHDTTLIIFRIPKGAKALYVLPISKRDFEAELVLDRNSKIVVKQILHRQFNNAVLLCDVIPDR